MATSAAAQQAAEPAPLPPLEGDDQAGQEEERVEEGTDQAGGARFAVQQRAFAARRPSRPSATAAPITPSTGNTLAVRHRHRPPAGLASRTRRRPSTSSPQRQLKEQNTTTVDQALRNVPGVTVNVGEGGGGMNGDQFRIRGFQAKGDLYIDGLRDFGVSCARQRSRPSRLR